jgi:hypothetical protein
VRQTRDVKVEIGEDDWTWQYRHVRGNYWGITVYVSHTITIADQLRGRRRLEVELHEFFHAWSWHEAEESVAWKAKQLSVILYDHLGYRASW